MAKLSMTNNPVVNRKRRYWLLEKRKRKLSALAQSARIEYNQEGMACRLIPNLDPRSRRARKLRAEIRAEQREIEKWIHKNGYTLA